MYFPTRQGVSTSLLVNLYWGESSILTPVLEGWPIGHHQSLTNYHTLLSLNRTTIFVMFVIQFPIISLYLWNLELVICLSISVIRSIQFETQIVNIKIIIASWYSPVSRQLLWNLYCQVKWKKMDTFYIRCIF